jgi:hypothetical protein
VLIVGGNQSAGGYDVDNSLRFNDGSSDYLSRTGTTPTNEDKATISFWVKRGALGTYQRIISGQSDVSGRDSIYFLTDDKLHGYVANATAGGWNTSMVFRDPSAWYHIVLAFDTTQATATNRLKVYVNGEEVSISFSGGNITQNTNLGINNSSFNTIGTDSDGPSEYFDGYLSEFVMVDGSQLDPTSFGEFDEDSGIWKPIDVSGLTFGNNGFYLPFKNSAALGQDDSGNGNNFTVNNLTSVDQSTDTPTNNSATLNPLVTLSGGTLSEGNTKFNYGSNGWRSSFSTIGANSGKWYCEVKYDSGTYALYGIVDEDGYSRNSGNQLADVTFNYSHGYGYFNNTGNSFSTGKDGQSIDASYGNSFTTGDIIGIAMDLDNGKLYFSKNGVFQNSGDPTSGATGTGSAYNITNSTSLFYFFGVSVYNGTALLNTGNPSFTISSGNSDANGYGNFEYAVPSGYYALNTKNLAEYG